MSPVAVGMSGAVYGMIALVLGIEFWRRCWRVWKKEGKRSGETTVPVSIFYLFMIFVAMLVDRLLFVPVFNCRQGHLGVKYITSLPGN